MDDFLTLRVRSIHTTTNIYISPVALARALGRIHSRHVVHGDVKPANFLYSCDTQVVHFFDFDLAFTFTGQSVALGAQTSPRGTFPYIAPGNVARYLCSILASDLSS